VLAIGTPTDAKQRARELAQLEAVGIGEVTRIE
jgi:hypothetical protein